jgi:hypothetical protein
MYILPLLIYLLLYGLSYEPKKDIFPPIQSAGVSGDKGSKAINSSMRKSPSHGAKVIREPWGS